MRINGRSLLTGSIIVTECTDWLSGPSWSRETVALPNVAGVIPVARTTGAARTMRLGLRLYPHAITDRPALLQETQDLLTGVLTVRTDDWPERIVRAVAGPLTVTASSPAMYASPWLEVQTTLTAYDAASYDDEPRLHVVGTSAAPIPVGTLPSPAVLLWQGSWSAGVSRTLTLRDAAGVARATLTVTPPGSESLGANDILEVDFGRRYVTKVASTGTRTNAYSWVASGTWPVLDPAFAVRDAGRWPSLEVSAGTAQLLSRRAYAL